MSKYFFLVVNILLSLTSIAYPLIWLLMEDNHLLTQLPLIMAILWGLKASGQWLSQHKKTAAFSLLLTALLALIYLSQSTQTMYWYPVLMNLLMLSIFGGSLFSSQSLVERMARLQTPNLTLRGVIYTRRVTQLWCGVFIFNSLIATLLIATKQYQWWALFNGVIAYIIMAFVMASEWLIRQKVKQYHSE